MDIFRRSRSTVRVGLDIGSSSVRVVGLVDKAGALELAGFGIEPLKQRQERAELIEAIKKVVIDAGITTKRVNTSISGQEVVVRYIQLPKMTEAELAGAISFESEKYIPFDIADVILDYQVLGKAERMMRVLLVAAKSELITDHIKVVEAAGLLPTLIDVDSFAIINSFQMNNPDQRSGTIALLNVGRRLTNINILKDGLPCLTRDIQVAGADITKAIAERLGIDLRAAEELKCNPANRSKEISEIASPVLESFLSEVRLSFDYYESQFEKGIDRVYLSGGSAGLEGFVQFLRENLTPEVEVWDPTGSLEVSPEIDHKILAEAASGLAVCIGLALRYV